MSRKIKLIWDFRGAEAEKTAEHHSIHLKEFADKEKIKYYKIDFEKLTEMQSVAFMAIDEADMIICRDSLKPNRATVYKE